MATNDTWIYGTLNTVTGLADAEALSWCRGMLSRFPEATVELPRSDSPLILRCPPYAVSMGPNSVMVYGPDEDSDALPRLIALLIDTAPPGLVGNAIVLSTLFVESSDPNVPLAQLKSWQLCMPWMQHLWAPVEDIKTVTFRTEKRSGVAHDHRLTFATEPAMVYWALDVTLSLDNPRGVSDRLQQAIQDLRQDFIEWTKEVRQDD
jgi:hypothetical protein